MDLNVKAANSLFSNPTKGAKNVPPASSNSERSALLNPKTSLTNGSNETSTTTRLQVIDESKNFTKDLSKQLEHWNLADAGFDYDIVAVFGSQSTGKSTLLNRLFGTTFDVMDETQRQQTTKGIWMCKAQGMNVMVMDVEGTDGRERGEDQDFERKAALFSLASSEVLIVNLWEHQVGLYQGANIGLLKTVFEVNLSLFGKKTSEGTRQRTLLLFVIRDFIGATPLTNLSQTLTQDMYKIWETITKPSGLEKTQLSDYFDLSFTALPHKILMPKEFEDEVVELRKRFEVKSHDDYAFRTEYHKRIPADGVSIYMESIWEQVQTNKDLDLPTQQELLAQFRCDEIASVALGEFNSQVKPQRRPIEAGRVIESLGAMISSWVSTTFARYDKEASRYHQGVYRKKRADLRTVMDNALSPLFLGQLKNLHKQCLMAFRKQLTDTLRGDSYNFADVVSSARATCENAFVAGAREALLKDTDWSYEDELELLKQEIKLVADQCRADETKKMVNQAERSFKRQVSEPVEAALLRATPTMWDDILKVYQSSLSRIEEVYLSKARSFDCTEEENGGAISTIRYRAWQSLRAKVDEQTADNALLGKLRTHFEERFRYDVEGVPRVWKPEDDIDGAFRKARDETLEFIPLFSKISPQDKDLVPEVPTPSSDLEDEFDFESSLTVLSEIKVLDLINRFRKDADAFYVEAKRSTVSSIAQIPMWMYAVLVVLGWNEAVAVLFNPLYFTMLLMGLAASYIIIQLGLVGPLMQVTRTVAGEVQRQAVNKLREQFAEPRLEVPMTASKNTTRVKREEDDERYDRQELDQRFK